MPKNQDLFNAIKSNGDIAKRKAALAAISTVNPENANDFRQAVVNHEAYWKVVNRDLMERGTVTNLLGRTNPDSNYFTSDNFLKSNDDAYSFIQLRQLAVEQLIKLGLNDVDDSVLIRILENNLEECRAYIAGRIQFSFLPGAHGWQPNVPHPDPDGEPPPASENAKILTENALASIKIAARDQLLLKLIPTLTNKDKLQAFEDATAADLNSAATTLGLPQGLTQALTHPLSPEVKTAINQRVTALKQADAKAGIDQYIANLSEGGLLGLQSTLEGDINQLQAKLQDPYKSDLLPDDLAKAKDKIAIRFLQVYLANNRTGDLIPAINSANANDLKTALKAIPSIGNNAAYIDSAINDANIHDVKIYLVKGFIAQQEASELDKLLALDKTDSLPKFKTALGALNKSSLSSSKITEVNWINTEDMDSMKQWARTRAFELQVAKASRFGVSAHPELIQVFNKLSPEDQRKVLELKPQPQALDILLNAKDPHIVKHYMGSGAENVSSIVDENKRLAFFKGIHNSEVARVLANFKPPITLDADKVSEINKLFVDATLRPPGAATINFTNNTDYLAFINKIGVQCGVSDKGKFYEAFSLSTDGRAFATDTTVRDTVSTQHAHNKDLLEEYFIKSYPDKEILSVYLNAKKNQLVLALDIRDPRPVIAGDIDTLRRELKNDLTPLAKSKMDAVNKSNLESPGGSDADQGYSYFEAIFKQAKESTRKVTKNAKKLKSISKIEEIHLMSAAFQGQPKEKSEEMLENLRKLAAQNELIIDQLERNLADLRRLEQSLPVNTSSVNSKVKKPVEKLKKNVDEEIEIVRNHLEEYKKVHDQLHGPEGLLKKIESAAQGTEQLVYRTGGFKYKVYKDEAGLIPRTLLAATDDPDAPPAVPSAEVVAGEAQGNALAFIVSEKIEEGKVGVHDFERAGATPEVKFTGRFFERHSVSKEKEPIGRFTVEAFPKGRPTEELKQARLNFSMGMAAQILANQDEMPTAKKPLRLRGTNGEMLQYIYTALVTLGVDKAAIKVESNAYDPKQEHGKLYGFTDGSLKTTLFDSKSNSYVVQKAKDELKALRANKTEKRKAVEKAVKTDIKLDEELEKTKAAIENEGPRPRSTS